MIHLRTRILSLLHSPSRFPASPVSPLFAPHRLLSTTTSIPPNPFSVQDYLVATCGLTRAQALKASKKLSHLSCSSKPDAVLAFLSGLGVPRSAVADLVAVDPLFLCASVERTLAPRVTELSDIGLSRSQIARLIPLALSSFRSSSLSRNLNFWLSVLGSFEKLLNALKMNFFFLTSDIEKVAKPNLALLQQRGISACHFSKPFISRVLVGNPKHLQDALVHVDKFGVPQESRMFHYALLAFVVQSREKLTEKIGILEMLGWSQNDVLIAVRKMPGILTMSKERLRRNVDFLTKDARLEISYIAQRPVLLKYSLERRLLPRDFLLKLLKVKGLLNVKFDYSAAAKLTEKKFLDKFVHPYKESVPGLADAYASSCAGKVPMELLSEKTRKLDNVHMPVLGNTTRIALLEGRF